MLSEHEREIAALQRNGDWRTPEQDERLRLILDPPAHGPFRINLGETDLRVGFAAGFRRMPCDNCGQPFGLPDKFHEVAGSIVHVRCQP